MEVDCSNRFCSWTKRKIDWTNRKIDWTKRFCNGGKRKIDWTKRKINWSNRKNGCTKRFHGWTKRRHDSSSTSTHQVPIKRREPLRNFCYGKLINPSQSNRRSPSSQGFVTQ